MQSFLTIEKYTGHHSHGIFRKLLISFSLVVLFIILAAWAIISSKDAIGLALAQAANKGEQEISYQTK